MNDQRVPNIWQEGSFSEEDIQYLIRNHANVFGQVESNVTMTLKVIGRIALEQIRAVNKFNEASNKLTGRIYWLTWALVALTAVITVFTVLLWFKG